MKQDGTIPDCLVTLGWIPLIAEKKPISGCSCFIIDHFPAIHKFSVRIWNLLWEWLNARKTPATQLRKKNNDSTVSRMIPAYLSNPTGERERKKKLLSLQPDILKPLTGQEKSWRLLMKVTCFFFRIFGDVAL